VKLGTRGGGYVEVLEGVKAGEAVVVSANFLIDAESNLKAALGAFSQGTQGARPDAKDPARPGANAAAAGQVSHRGEGSIEAVDASHSTITLAHGPIASLKWPAMSMDFRVKDPALIRTLKPGQKIDFEFVDAGGGDYLIVRAQPAAGGHGKH
jgi:membrane fusion protein, copper/silver efflux system